MRHYHRFFGTGKPTGKINLIFLKKRDGNRLALGSFCFSPGGQLIFFPEIRNRQPLYQYDNGKKIPITSTRDIQIDHCSLEPNMKSWHLRYYKNGQKIKIATPYRFNTLNENGLYYWFALSFNDPRCLNEIPEKSTNISLGRFTPNEAESILYDFIKSREDSVFHDIQLPHEPNSWEGHFIFISFIIDTRPQICGTDLYKAFINIPDIKLTKMFGNQYCSHPVKIPTYPYTIWVTTAVVPGKPKAPALISSYC